MLTIHTNQLLRTLTPTFSTPLLVDTMLSMADAKTIQKKQTNCLNSLIIKFLSYSSYSSLSNLSLSYLILHLLFSYQYCHIFTNEKFSNIQAKKLWNLKKKQVLLSFIKIKFQSITTHLLMLMATCVKRFHRFYALLFLFILTLTKG